MEIKNNLTGEVKKFNYDFMGNAEASRLISTGQWTKVGGNDIGMGINDITNNQYSNQFAIEDPLQSNNNFSLDLDDENNNLGY